MTGRRFTHALRVRYHECDPQGIVFNANYFAYCDIALTEFLREALGGYSRLRELGADLVVLEASARFHGSAAFDEELELAYLPRALGTTSLRGEVEIVRDGTLLVAARLVHVFVDAETLGKAPPPGEIRAAIEPWLAAAA